MVVKTNTLRVLNARRTVLELMLSDHPKDCLTCQKSGECELQTLAQKFGIRETPYDGGEMSHYRKDISPSIIRDMARDRWRIFKCRERIKQVNLGGTAIGTGLGAPRQFIFRAAEQLRNLTGLPVSRAENCIDATSNADSFVEVSGLLSALAADLLKISSDLRLLASGPGAGLAEIHLPDLQAGSSIMSRPTTSAG